ncbi:MAG: AAA family ATPase [Candidatus Micrarchaeia archaeon]
MAGEEEKLHTTNRGEKNEVKEKIKKEFGEKALRVYEMGGKKTIEEIMKKLGITKKELVEILMNLEKKGYLRMEDVVIPKEKRKTRKFDCLIEEPVPIHGTDEYAEMINNGNYYYEIEEWEEAEKYYKKATEHNKERWEGYYGLVLVQYRMKEYNKAVAELLKSEVFGSERVETVEIHLLKGAVYYKKQQFNDAIKECDRAIMLNPHCMKAFYNRGLSYADLENYEKAIQDFSKVIELKPDFAEAWHLRGVAKEYAGKLKEAVEDYEKALKLDPNMVEAKAYMEATKIKMEQQAGERMRAYRKRGPIELNFELNRVNFQNIAGLNEWKKRINLEVIEPLKNRKMAEKYGIKSGNILLYGPPGCGKSLIAEAIAGELGVKMVRVSVADVLNMYVGNSEKNMKLVFEKAKENQQCVVIFDDIEGLGGMRDTRAFNIGVVSEFLNGMDEIEKKGLGIVVIGTTNMPWLVDSAVVRRFNSIVYIPEPDFETRKELFKYYTRNLPVEEIDFDELARRTDGMASSNIENICKKAGLFAYRDALEEKERKVRMDDFESAMKEEKSAITLWKEQSRNYTISPLFKELTLKEGEKKTGMYR